MSIFAPDAFERDWYGYLTNQVSHIGAGVAVAFVVCLAALVVFGEFPGRYGTWVLIAVGYGLYELRVQKWNGFDTIEDWLFKAAYGAGGVLHSFHETNSGTGDFQGNVWDIVPFLVVSAVHLALGVLWRVWQARRARGRDAD